MTDYPRGWTCEVTVVRLEAYVRCTLPRTESLLVADHLEACHACAQLVMLMVDHGPEAGTPFGTRRSRG